VPQNNVHLPRQLMFSAPLLVSLVLVAASILGASHCHASSIQQKFKEISFDEMEASWNSSVEIASNDSALFQNLQSGYWVGRCIRERYDLRREAAVLAIETAVSGLRFAVKSGIRPEDRYDYFYEKEIKSMMRGKIRSAPFISNDELSYEKKTRLEHYRYSLRNLGQKVLVEREDLNQADRMLCLFNIEDVPLEPNN